MKHINLLSSDPYPKKMRFTEEAPKPFSYFDNPENISWDDLGKLVDEVLSSVASVSLFDNPKDFKNRITHASAVWFNQISNHPYTTTSKKVHSLCINLILKAQIYEVSQQTAPLKCHLSDLTTVNISQILYEILYLASPVIKSMFSNNMLESNSGEFKLNVSSEIFDEICRKLLNPDYCYKENTNRIELLAGIYYLGLDALKKELLDALDKIILDAKPEMMEEILTLYKTYIDFSDIESFRLDYCHAALMKMFAWPFSVKEHALNLDAINQLIPGLRVDVPAEDFDKRIYLSATVDITVEDQYKTLRSLLKGIQLIHEKKYIEAKVLFPNTKKFWADKFGVILCTREIKHIELLCPIWFVWYSIARKCVKKTDADLCYRKALELQPDCIELINSYIYFLETQNEFSSASIMLQKKLSLLPPELDTETFLQRAEIEVLKSGGFDGASVDCPAILVDLDKVIQNTVNMKASRFHLHALHFKGVVLYQAGKFSEGVDAFTLAIEYAEKNKVDCAKAYLGRGLCRNAQNLHADASNDFEKIEKIQTHKISFSQWTKVANSQRQSNRLNQAYQSISKAKSEISSQNLNEIDNLKAIPTLMEEVEINLVLTKYDDVLQVCKKIEEINHHEPNLNIRNCRFIQVKIIRIKTYRLKKENGKAMDEINSLKHVQIPPEQLEPLRLETSKLHVGDLEFTKAIRVVNKLLEMNENNLEGLCIRGTIYLNRKSKISSAIADFQKVLQIKPEHADAMQGLKLAQEIKANRTKENQQD